MFDEVDAHLDAPNAEKLSNIIKKDLKVVNLSWFHSKILL